jgi:hypothetical protein
MAKKRKAHLPIDRASEYIDSPLMTQRLRYRRDLSVRIAGNYGVYRTQCRIGRGSSGTCSCPSEGWPCKHVRALEATWKDNPSSFLDLEGILGGLSAKPKAILLALIGRMAMLAPESLAACGIEGFEPEDPDSEFG